MIPGKDLALATRFKSYEEAAKMADKIGADDPEWTYGVVRLDHGAYVIAVADESNDEVVPLGYL